jgi:hypothetical protein
MPNVINIPQELAHELDLLARAEHKRRTPYVVELLWRDIRRNKQLQALKLSSGSWNPDDHPELAQGGAAHIEKIRSEHDDAIRRNQTADLPAEYERIVSLLPRKRADPSPAEQN